MAGSDKEVQRKADTIMHQADVDGDGVVNWGAPPTPLDCAARRGFVLLTPRPLLVSHPPALAAICR